MPKPKRSREYLTPEEINKLLAAAKAGATRNATRDFCMLLLAYRHGLRASELCNIRLSDIDLASKTFHVRRSKNGDHGVHDLYAGEPSAIRAWLTLRSKMNVPSEVETLFVSERRKPFTRFGIFVLVRKVAEEAGLSHLDPHPHSLRHSCGYALIQKTDVRVCQDFLGHKSISSTVRYTKLCRNRFAKLF